jgi:hypothetical protein
MTLLQQLQEDAVNPQVDITTLLRRARILAARLKNTEFEKWIKDELDGYKDGGLPDYRVLKVQSQADLIIGYTHFSAANVMASLMPKEYRHWADTLPLANSISELASWVGAPARRRSSYRVHGRKSWLFATVGLGTAMGGTTKRNVSELGDKSVYRLSLGL